MIVFKQVSKKFNQIKALDNLSFTIQRGEVVGLLGPNGAGKTTAMRLLLGLIEPNQGQILIDDKEVKEETLNLRKKIGYLPENNPLYQDFKVAEYLELIRKIRGQTERRFLKTVIETCGLSDVLNQKIEYLSKGFKQRVGLAQALIGDPEILVLDEPTVGLDPNQIIEIRHLIKSLSRKKTVILSSHILSEVQAICQKVIIIHQGKLVAEGDLKKLTKGKSLEKIFQKLTLS